MYAQLSINPVILTKGLLAVVLASSVASCAKTDLYRNAPLGDAGASDGDSDGDSNSDSDTGDGPFDGMDPGDLAWADEIVDGTAWDVATRADNTAVVLTLPGGVSAYDEDGQVVWSKTVVEAGCYGEGDEPQCLPGEVAVLPDGTFTVVGDVKDDALFGAGGAIEIPFEGAVDNTRYLYLAKFDETGDLLWVSTAAGIGESIGQALAPTPDGGFVVCGVHDDGAVLGEGEAGETELSAIGPGKILIARYSADGDIVWASSIEGSYGGSCGGIAFTPAESVAVEIEFAGTVELGLGQENETSFSSQGNTYSASTRDVFVALFTGVGVFEWASVNNGPYGDSATGIRAISSTATASCGSVHYVATFGSGQDSEVPLQTYGETDGFLVKHNAEGEIEWVRKMGGSVTDEVFDAAVTAEGEPIVTGYFRWGITFDSGDEPSFEIEADGTKDMFVAQYDSDGVFAWGTHAGGGPLTYGRAVDVAADGGIIVVGSFTQKVTFGQGEPNEIEFTTSDSFIAKYAP